MNSEFVQTVIMGYNSIIELALPVVLFIAGCNIGINIIVTAFCTGKLKIGGKP